MQNSRNLEKEGVLINIYFFCKAVGLPKPTGMSNPIEFMNNFVAENNLDWTEIASKVKVYRDAYKDRRRTNHKKKAVAHKQEQEHFFEINNRNVSKNRKCLRCDSIFLSKTGNRNCDKCNYIINNFLGEDGVYG